MLIVREIFCSRWLYKLIKPDILELFANRYGIAISAEDGQWTWLPIVVVHRTAVPSQYCRMIELFYWTLTILPAWDHQSICLSRSESLATRIWLESQVTPAIQKLQDNQCFFSHSLLHCAERIATGPWATIEGLREALTSEVSVSFCGSDHNRETFVVDVRQGHNGECRNFSHFYMYFMCFFMAYMLHVFLYIFSLSQPFEIKDRVLR